MESWTTLYDVTRDGIGVAPWILAAMWLAGIWLGAITVKSGRRNRVLMSLWLLAWIVLGGLGSGNVFYQYAANYRALKAGSCSVIEGQIENFHPEDHAKKSSEKFAVNGHEFSYFSANLGGGGLRSSAGFRIPLRDGLYVKVWYHNGAICRLDARN